MQTRICQIACILLLPIEVLSIGLYNRPRLEHRVRIGMSVAEVEALFAPRPIVTERHSRGQVVTHITETEEGRLVVSFNVAGVVQWINVIRRGNNYMEEPADENYISAWLRRFGW